MKNYCFQEHLDQFGPQTGDQIIAVDEALRYCRDLSQQHYENFSVVSLLLKKSLRQHFANVYSYCRWADDLSDEIKSTSQSLELLEWWRGELDRCFLGSATHPVFIALQFTNSIFNLPKQPFVDLIDAFEQDQTHHQYETFEQLKRYCSKSANPVGRLVLCLGNSSSEENRRLSDSICTGLQLANFLQDIARDADIGRIYLPAETLDRFKYSQVDFANQTFNEHFRDLMKFEVYRAEQFFLDGADLVNRVDSSIAPSVELFLRGGMSILSAIRAVDYNVWKQRPKLTKFKKIQLLLQAMVGRLWGRRDFTVKKQTDHKP